MFSRKTRQERFAAQRTRMVERQLRRRNVVDEDVLAAMGEVPRELFLPREQRAMAYQDRALPLTGGQTMSQPYMVAAMTEALDLSPGARVLEIGTGSGYQTAVLARLAEEVYTIERHPAWPRKRARCAGGGVRQRARACWRRLSRVARRGTLRRHPGDGRRSGRPEPAGRTAPPGRRTVVIPVGSRRIQQLMRIRRTRAGTITERLMECAFVPLVGAEGW